MKQIVDVAFLTKDGHRITHIAASENGEYLATGSSVDIHIWRWDIKEGELCYHRLCRPNNTAIQRIGWKIWT